MDSQRLREIFEKDGTFAIVVGTSYTIDEMGASLALYLGLSAKGKDVSIVSAKQPLVEVSNLVGINRVKSQVESKGGDLVVSFPYRDNEIGKVSYTLEGGFLNIIVKPKENQLSFGENDVVFKRSGETPSVLINVGVKKLSELSSFFNIEGLKDTTIINIDRAGNNEGYGDVVIIGQNSSSVSEQVADLLLALSFPIDQDMAQNLMSGIITATGNFQSPKTSSLAFEMAGILLRNGAQREMPRPAVGQRPQQRPQRITQPFPYDQRRDQQQRPQQQQVPNQQRTQQRQPESLVDKGGEAPPDWLAPKIYKGSTNVE